MFAAAHTSKLPLPLATAIEDAVLLGNAKEIEGVLELIGEDESFPQVVRNALETLRYFTLCYGKGGECEPMTEKDRQAVVELESMWRRELIAMIGSYSENIDNKKYG